VRESNVFIAYGFSFEPAHPADQTSHGKWWEIFGDPELNELEEQIAGSNQNLRVAEARFREARAAIRFNRASQFPTISTAPSASYVKNSDYSSSFSSKIQQSSKGDFVLPFDLSYELDLWGRVRRSVAAAREEAQATAADYETAKLSLEAELALDYFELRSADAQKQLLDDTVKAYTDNLQLTANRFKGGAWPPRPTLRKRKPSWIRRACKTRTSPWNERNLNVLLRPCYENSCSFLFQCHDIAETLQAMK
jgi:outer membrane protein TolC